MESLWIKIIEGEVKNVSYNLSMIGGHFALNAIFRSEIMFQLLKEYVRYGVFTLLWFFKLYYFAKTLGLKFVTLPFYMVSGGSILLLSFWILLLKKKKKGLIILDIILTIIILGDIVYFRYFGDFLSLSLIQQAGQMGDIKDSIAALFRWSDLWLFGTFLLYFIPFKEAEFDWKWRTGFSIGTLLIGLFMFLQPVNQYINTNGKALFLNNWWNVSIYNIVGLPGFHGYDAYQTIQEWMNRRELTSEEIDELNQYLDKKQKEPALEFGKYKGKNVIVLQLEAIQSFLIGKSINGQEITPNMNQFINEMYYFPNAYHQAFQGRTSDAEFVTNTSLYPVTKGVVYKRYGTHTYPSIASSLKKKDYHTFAFHAWEKSFWNRAQVYKNYPFDTFYGIEDFKSKEQVGWSVGDEPMLVEMVDVLKESQPFYGFGITLSSHHPYTIDGKYYELNVEGIEDNLLRHYIHAAHYVDRALGTFKKKMEAEGLWDNTIVFIYGDHDAGITLTDHDRSVLDMGNNNFTDWNMKKGIVYFAHAPGQKEGMTIEHPVGQADTAPTILSWLGIEKPRGMLGQHILEDEKNVFFRDGSFVTNTNIYQASIDGIFEKGICIDLASHQDVDVNSCKKPYSKGLEALKFSDRIVEYNFFGKK